MRKSLESFMEKANSLLEQDVLLKVKGGNWEDCHDCPTQEDKDVDKVCEQIIKDLEGSIYW